MLAQAGFDEAQIGRDEASGNCRGIVTSGGPHASVGIALPDQGSSNPPLQAQRSGDCLDLNVQTGADFKGGRDHGGLWRRQTSVETVAAYAAGAPQDPGCTNTA